VIEDGLDGVIGLSFDGPGASPITKALEKQGVIGPLGQPFLYNVFDETPSQNNFIGISLSRTGDLEGSAEALFTINEYDEDYEAVADAPHVPLFPGPPMSSRWSVLVDSIVVDSFPLSIQSVVPGTPEGKLVVLMDTGVPTASLPASLRDQLYSRIAGAQYYKPYDKWIVPCGATAIVWVSIG
jgi:saccharopepsin